MHFHFQKYHLFNGLNFLVKSNLVKSIFFPLRENVQNNWKNMTGQVHMCCYKKTGSCIWRWCPWVIRKLFSNINYVLIFWGMRNLLFAFHFQLQHLIMVLAECVVYEHTSVGSLLCFAAFWLIEGIWRHLVCDFITMTLTHALIREGELQGVCWDCIRLVLLITCLALLSASCNITWLKKMCIVCRSYIDFKDLKGNRLSVFVIFPQQPQIESEEPPRLQWSY